MLIHSNESNRQHFQPTLHSPPKVKIHEIKTHEPSSFLKRGHKLQSICTIRVKSIESTTFLTHPTLFVQVGFRHIESTAGETIRVNSIELITFSTHPQGPDQLYFCANRTHTHSKVIEWQFQQTYTYFGLCLLPVYRAIYPAPVVWIFPF